MAGKGGARKGAGRKPKADEQRIRDLTSPYVPEAIETVVAILKDTEAKTADRISASKLLLSYAWGTPKQTIDSTTNVNINDFDITKLYDNKTKEDME